MRHLLLCLLLSFSWLLAAQTIILDPGHGGIYYGQISATRKFKEKDVVLDLAKRLAARLKKKGHKVILTRETDKEFDKKNHINDLTQRAQFSQKYKADIFISLHLNSSVNKGLRGYEIYVPFECKYPQKCYKLACSLHYELSHKIKPRFYGGTLRNHNNIDMGIKAAKYNILVKSKCPTVVIELEYISNQQAERDLLTDVFRDQLVRALYCGIRRYFEC